MRRFGCLGILLVIALLTLEFYVLLVAMELMKDVLGPLLILAVMTIIGVKVAQFHARRLPQALVTGQGGGRLIGLIGALLIVLPGFISGIVGLILQVPFMQRLFSRVGMVLAASMVKRAMGGGLAKGFPGGFPGGAFPPGGFPGLKPDEQLPLKKPAPKTYDVEPDKD